MTKHQFGSLFRHPQFLNPIRVCAGCSVIQSTVDREFHYYGKEHMGTGHDTCPARFGSCGTSPDHDVRPDLFTVTEPGEVVPDLEIAPAIVFDGPLQERRQR